MSSKSGKSSLISKLQKRLGYQFDNLKLLERALTHTSAKKERVGDYERLEFLGDRVLGLVVAEMLWDRFPKESEGDLAKRHAHLVRGATVAEVALSVNLGQVLRLSKGERDSGGQDNPHLLADACEAVIAAIYIDGGFAEARRVVSTLWEKQVASHKQPPRDSKTLLQEWVQAKGHGLPQYKLISREGPPHDPFFTIEVSIQGQQPSTGTGKSKRIAEQQAAKLMLEKVASSG